jgi:hypothetical protein
VVVDISQRPALDQRFTRHVPSSATIYAVACVVVVAVYLAVWLTHFQYVYGWLMDDRTVFIKGLDTVHDWKNAFAYYNALQPYFYVISYLPLWSGLSLPSYPLPMFGDTTGQFRFLLLWALLLHALLLLIWAWTATRFTRSRLAAWLSVVLLATSPTYILWSPQPESRLLGMPFALPGLWLLLRPNPPARRLAAFGIAFLAGSLFGVAQSIHYTSLYLIVPVALLVWTLRLWHGWRTTRYWQSLLGFVLGCVWQQAMVEVVSDFIVGLPWQKGPTMTLLELRNMHSAYLSLLGNLALWTEWFGAQLGVPLLIAIGLGAVLFVREQAGPGSRSRASRLELTLGVLLAVLYLGLSGSMALFRQTSVLQPFLFLFASVAIVQVARWLGQRHQFGQAAVCAGLLLGVGIIPWSQAHAVFDAHQGLGRALDWVYAHKGDRPLEWLKIAWYGDPQSLLTEQELRDAPRGAWLFTYFPYQFMDARPSLVPAFEATPPLAAWGDLWTTDTIQAEMEAYWPNQSWQVRPVMNEARVYDIASLLAQMDAGQPLEVSDVLADSASIPQTEPTNVFDHDASPDHVRSWQSTTGPMPHWLEFHLAQTATLSAMQVVLSQTPDHGLYRIDNLEVQVANSADGELHTVWQADDLHNLPIIDVRWSAEPVWAVRVIVHHARDASGPISLAAIEEIVLPGYHVVAPSARRTFPPLTLKSLAVSNDALLALSENATNTTVLALGDKTYALRPGKDPGQLLARLPTTQRDDHTRVDAFLADGIRRSNSISVSLAPAVITDVQPRTTSVGVAFVPQPDGTSVLSITCDGGGPGDVVLFDDTALPTIYGNEHWLVATVRPELLARPGRHTIRLRNMFGVSNRIDFEVTR